MCVVYISEQIKCHQIKTGTTTLGRCQGFSPLICSCFVSPLHSLTEEISPVEISRITFGEQLSALSGPL